MFNIILYQPEIPPNTGNIIRLCANTGAQLHLIRPLGFDLDDRNLRRAGLDYHEYATIQVHDNLAACLLGLPHAGEARLPHPCVAVAASAALQPRPTPCGCNPDGTTSHPTRLPNNVSQVVGYPPTGAPKAGNPLSSKLDVELTQGTNVSLRKLVVSRRLFAFTTKASRPYHEVQYQASDAFLFGPESRGLPSDVLELIAPERRLRLPMLPGNRSLNLSNTVAVAVYEAWRQCGFEGQC